MTGTPTYYLTEERQRNINLTNIISLSLFGLSLLVGLAYFFASARQILYLSICLFSAVFLLPFILNKFGFHNAGRLLLSSIIPIMVMTISIHNKGTALGLEIINPVNYFDVRIALLNAAIIPFVLFSLHEVKWLLMAYSPTLLSVTLFDPLHNYFNVGYYQAGLESTDYYFSANLFTCITLIFVSLVIYLLKNQVLRSDQRQNSENKKMKFYLEVLISLGISDNVNSGFVNNAKKEILATAKNCFNISSVSIWNYDESDQSIECTFRLENGQVTAPKTKLREKDYPQYFKEIVSQKLIIARDAAHDKKTMELADSYLAPLNIRSMMIAPYLYLGKLGGIICCENQTEPTRWGAAESMLLKGLGDFLSYAISVNLRKKQNQLLIEKNNEISQINENLETTIAKRTQELKEKNKQLTEYAYINSHILKAPVARISGLYNLFQLELKEQASQEIFSHMNSSIVELEKITLQINEAIEENGIFDRSHLNN